MESASSLMCIKLLLLGILLLCSSGATDASRMGQQVPNALACVGKGEQCGPDPQYWCCGDLTCVFHWKHMRFECVDQSELPDWLYVPVTTEHKLTVSGAKEEVVQMGNRFNEAVPQTMTSVEEN